MQKRRFEYSFKVDFGHCQNRRMELKGLRDWNNQKVAEKNTREIIV